MFPVLIKAVKDKLLEGLCLVGKTQPSAELYQIAEDCNVGKRKRKNKF